MRDGLQRKEGAFVFWVTALLAAVLVSPRAPAQVLPPRPLWQMQPDAPTNRGDVPLEGWVVLRYSVLSDGSTDNIVVIDRQPPMIPYRRAVAAVERWRFRPATADGAAIDWHNNEAAVVFRSEDARLSPLFFRAYEATQALIEEGKLEWARRNNERTLARATRLEVIGQVLIQSVIINLQLGELHAAYAALVRATDPRIGLLRGQDLIVALKHRNAFELRLGDTVGALETLERRSRLAPVPADDAVARRAAFIERALYEGSTIGHRAKILDDVWRHRLNRQIFAIDKVEGEIDVIRAVCDRTIAELEYWPNSEWTLPRHWGNCAVAVEGRDQTGFVLYEFEVPRCVRFDLDCTQALS
ncbi:MAG: energy transducer TonB, partial [Gammaproteobacteria bacterium]